MLVLKFRIGDYIYGLEVSLVAEVVPEAVYKELPRSPEFVKGLFNYRGSVTPVVDLSMLASGISCKQLMSSRVIVVDIADFDADIERGKNYLGLLAENITETVKVSGSDFEEPGLEIPDAPWLGKVAMVNGVMLQLIKPAMILTDELRRIIFSGEEQLEVDM